MILSYQDRPGCERGIFYESVLLCDSDKIKGLRIGHLLKKLGARRVHDMT